MYKILIRYTSTLNKIFWQSHMVTNEDGEVVEFATDDFEVLREEIKKLNSEYGNEDLRVINDITYVVRIEVFDDIENVSTVSSEDVEALYSTAFDKVFGQEGN